MKAISWLPLALLVVSAGLAQPSGDSTDPRFNQAADLRSRGEYSAAIEVLTGIIQDSSQPEQDLRRAYSELVWTIMAESDEVSERARQTDNVELRNQLDVLARRLGEVVGEALERFADIRADETVLLNASRVNQMYEANRQRMFGNLEVESTPDSAEVWINDGEVGWTSAGRTPLRRSLFPVGEYEIRLSRDGHHDENITARITPNKTRELTVPLRRKRSKTWWVTRVVVPAASAVGILVYALTSGDDAGTPEPEPLPLPPDPPE